VQRAHYKAAARLISWLTRLSTAWWRASRDTRRPCRNRHFHARHQAPNVARSRTITLAVAVITCQTQNRIRSVAAQALMNYKSAVAVRCAVSLVSVQAVCVIASYINRWQPDCCSVHGIISSRLSIVEPQSLNIAQVLQQQNILKPETVWVRGPHRGDFVFFSRTFCTVAMPKTFMVKKHHRLPATSTPTRVSTSGEKMTSRSGWSPFYDSPINYVCSDHVVQQTGRTLVDIGQLACVTSSRECVTSFPVISRQHNTLWSPYLDVKIGELLLSYCYLLLLKNIFHTS